MYLSGTSTCLLNTSRDGDSTTSVGSLFHCSTTILVKNFFLIADLNLSWCSLRPFPLLYHLLHGRRDRHLPHYNSFLCSSVVLGPEYIYLFIYLFIYVFQKSVFSNKKLCECSRNFFIIFIYSHNSNIILKNKFYSQITLFFFSRYIF